MERIISDLTIPQQPKYTKKDLFYILTNFRCNQKYSDEITNNPNLFFLYVMYKIPFDLNVLELQKEKYGEYIKKIKIWNAFLATGKAPENIPNLFENGDCVLLKEKKIKPGTDINADQIDIALYCAHKSNFKNRTFYSGGMALPGMLSYKLKLPIITKQKNVVFLSGLTSYTVENDETVDWVSTNQKTLEQIKLNVPDVLILVAEPYRTTKHEYMLAYVLCHKKLIIVKDCERQNLIKQWLSIV